MVLTGHSHNDQRLRSKEREDHSSQDRGQQDLVDTVTFISLLKHVQREGKRWKDAVVEESARAITLHAVNHAIREETYLAKYMYTVAGTTR